MIRTTSWSAALLGVALVLSSCGSKKPKAGEGNFPTAAEAAGTVQEGQVGEGSLKGRGTQSGQDSGAPTDGMALPDADAAAREAAEREKAAREAAERAAKGLRPAGETGTEGAPIAELPPIFFKIDSDVLDDAAQAGVAKAAEFLKSKATLQVVLRGNADDTGTEEYNFALGSRRAEAVRDALVAAGVAGERLDTISFGETMPADPAETETARAANRRVEFFVYEK